MGATERLVLDLPAYLVSGLRESVRSGAYPTESAAIEQLLLAWYGPNGTDEPPIELLRAFVAESIAEIDAGRGTEASEVFDELEARYQSMIVKHDQ
jgi:Arc/MetJ-type ribon-helix-helix transcriptional regulator